ncbi:hypothetical protein [Polaromonas sp. CG_23.6]|uniref:hypothetical protein n=1 Tax=Polaromonas sp. CG_23.6 TaxID=2760709 RepID=UPI00247333D3|nr:hypothetical protein [Polaromonas sp. CG_23.6]MDH6186930.1 hypothetical protein [Polaromonas sp. CG_23.6]
MDVSPFDVVVQRASTDSEKQHLHRMRKELNLHDRDPVWQISMMNEAFLVRLLEVSRSITTAGSKGVETINKMGSLVIKDVDKQVEKAIELQLTQAKRNMHRAAVEVFKDLNEEAKNAVINAGKDIAAVDKATVEAMVIRDQAILMKRYAFMGIGLFLAALLAGVGMGIGYNALHVSGLRQEVGAAHLASQAAANRATAAQFDSAAAVAAATKKIGAELAAVRERAGWAGSIDGAKVAGCKLPGWEQRTDTNTGNPFCIVRQAEKPTFGADIAQVDFWMPKTKK